MNKLPLSIMLAASAGSMVVASCATNTVEHDDETQAKHGQYSRPGLSLIAFRALDGGDDGLAIVDLDPESWFFGKLTDRLDVGPGVVAHHPYLNHDEEKLYLTALGGDFLYSVGFYYDWWGMPQLTGVTPLDTGGMTVGEDMYFTHDGTRYYVTFMGGDGSLLGGAVNVYDAETDELIEVIQATKPADPSSTEPYILWPHGISADEERNRLMVASCIHPDTVSGIGNTLTTIDMTTNTPIKTQLAADSADDLSSPVEVLLTRDDLPPVALTGTEFGNDIWAAPFDPVAGDYGPFIRVVEGEDRGLAVPLEFYIYPTSTGEKELFVSWGVPGVVEVYSLDSLPALPLKRSFATGAGAHHMVFFRTKGGREVVAVQNNLLNFAGLNAGTITVHDVYTGELLGTADLPSRYDILPESVEGAYGHGDVIHH
jgi:hypothetical protein